MFSDRKNAEEVVDIILTTNHQAKTMIIKVAAATFRRPLAGISVSGLRFRCFGHQISKFPAPERWDFNISGSGASGFQDFQLRTVAISIFPASERLRSVEIKNFQWKSRIFDPEGGAIQFCRRLRCRFPMFC